MIEQRCGNCMWFSPEPETEIESQSAAGILGRMTELSPSLAGGSTRPMYGKCKAQYTDKADQSQRYDLGVLSNLPCKAADDQGKLLFKAKDNL